MPKKAADESKTAPNFREGLIQRLDAERFGLREAIVIGFIHSLMFLFSAAALDGGVLAARYTFALTIIAALAGLCFLLRVARLHTIFIVATIVSLFVFLTLMILPPQE
jgi:hypothetical protein